MKKILLSSTLFLIIFLLMSCTPNLDRGIKPEIYETTRSITHALTEHQSDFFKEHIILDYDHTDIGFIIEYSDKSYYPDKKLSLVTDDETLWTIGPYLRLDYSFIDEDTLVINYHEDRFSYGRMYISIETGDISHHTTFPYIVGYGDVTGGYVLVKWASDEYDGRFIIQRTHDDGIETTYQFTTYWLHDFMRVDHNKFIIVAEDRIPTDIGEDIYKRLIIINDDGDVLEDHLFEKNVLVEYFEQGFAVFYDSKTVVLYNYDFEEVNRLAVDSNLNIKLNYETHHLNGIVLKKVDFPEESYVFIDFDGNITYEFTYPIDTEEPYQSFYYPIVSFSNGDVIELLYDNHGTTLQRKNQLNNILWQFELESGVYQIGVSDSTIMIGLQEPFNKFQTYSFDGEQIKDRALECKGLISSTDSTYTCIDSNIKQYDLDDDSILWENSDLAVPFGMKETPYGSYIVSYLEEYDPTNSLPSLSPIRAALVSYTGEIIKTFDDFHFSRSFIFDDRLFMIGRKDDDFKLMAFEVDNQGEIINTYTVVDTYYKDDYIYDVLLENSELVTYRSIHERHYWFEYSNWDIE